MRAQRAHIDVLLTLRAHKPDGPPPSTFVLCLSSRPARNKLNGPLVIGAQSDLSSV
jgi:hypothetical protein